MLSSQVITYAYDSLYRLTNADYSPSTGSGQVFTYTYDAVGNRLTQTTLTNTTVYTYDNANRLINVNGVAQIWDNNGNLLNDGASTYAHDAANRLMTVTQGANVYAFGYNGQGDRVRQTVNGVVTTYTLDLNAGLTQVLADVANGASNTYLYGTTRIGEQQPGGLAYHLPDALGSVRQLANGSGGVMLAKSYQPFGEVMSSAGNGTSAFGWAGEARDATGLVFLRARYYSVTTGRFFVRDSWPGNVQMPGTLHPYLYAADNPINATDPSGYICIWGNDVAPLSLSPCTSQQVAEAQAQQMAIGNSIAYAKQFGDMLLHHPVETQGRLLLNASASFWQTPMVQTPIANRDVLLGYKQADAWERLDASARCAFSTAIPIAQYGLMPYALVNQISLPLLENENPSYLDPRDIRYTQRSYSPSGPIRDENGAVVGKYYVEENVQWLQAHPGEDLPWGNPIRIFKNEAFMDDWGPMTKFGHTGDPKNLINGEVYTLDHRRLVAYRLAGNDSIPVQWASLSEIWNERFKFSTPNGGVEIFRGR